MEMHFSVTSEVKNLVVCISIQCSIFGKPVRISKKKRRTALFLTLADNC